MKWEAQEREAVWSVYVPLSASAVDWGGGMQL